MKKMYLFLAEGFEEIAALAPVDVMRRAGLRVVMVSTTENLVVQGAHGIPVVADALFSELDYADAALLFLPGGLPGATNLEAHRALGKLLVEKASEEVVVSATKDKNGLVLVTCGILKTKVTEDKLRLIEGDVKFTRRDEPKPKPQEGKVKKSIVSTFKTEVDVRGMIGDDAWFVVDKYLDDAIPFSS